MKKIIIFIVICFVRFSAQEKVKYSGVFTAYLGKGMGNIKGVESNNAKSYKLGIQKKLNPDDAEWIKYLHAENVSVSIIYSDLDGMIMGYPFGKTFGLLTEADFKIFQNSNFKLCFVAGFGIAYASKTIFTDPNTFIFGSHLNAIFSSSVNAEYQFQKDWSLFSTIDLIHYSNGSVRIPNAGVNLMNIGVGIKKDFEINSQKKFRNTEMLMKKNGLEISFGAGERGKYKTKNGFFKMGFYAGYNHFINNVLAFRMGLDAVYYDKVYNPAVYEDSVPYWGKSYEHFRLGASAGIEVKMNDFAINTNFGRYVYFKSPYHQKMYWNASLKYYLSKNYGVVSTLNAHKFQADFVNWGLFYRF